MDRRRVGVLGASSLVGECLLQLLADAGWSTTAFARKAGKQSSAAVTWCVLPVTADGEVPLWICVAPIWVLPDYFSLLEASHVKRIVALSSTSRFTKDDSSDAKEQAVALALADAEERLCTWAASKDVEWIILRPTMIYGLGRDKNIAEMARFIRRFKFFPVFANAEGLRQPVHVEDVASACFAAIESSRVMNQAYNISGAETLTYRQMVSRVFTALGRRPRLLSVPLSVFRLIVACGHLLPRYRHWSVAMAERMGRDLIFDHSNAARELRYCPRPFVLAPGDLPR